MSIVQTKKRRKLLAKEIKSIERDLEAAKASTSRFKNIEINRIEKSLVKAQIDLADIDSMLLKAWES